MKKTLIALATLAALSSATFAATKTDEDKKMRHEFMVMTQKMITDEMEMVKKLNAMLTAYQAQLKQMMENESGDN